MRRRALLNRGLLGSLGVVSAGCVGSTPFGGSSTDETSEEETTRSTTTLDPPADAEYELTDLEVSTRTDRPSVRYVLKPSAFYSGDAVEREEDRTGEEQVVMAVSEIDDPEVRNAVETAIRDDEWRSDSLPDGLADLVERVDFFTGASSGTYTHVGLALHRLSPDAPPAIEFPASVEDPVVSPGDPGAVTFSLTNASPEPRTVFSGTVPPFGVVVAESTDTDDQFLLWRPYENEGCVNFQEESWYRCSIGITTELAPGETIARKYEVLPSTTDRHPNYTVPPGPGTYRVSDSLSHYEQTGAPESKLSFEVEFSLESLADDKS